MLHNIGPWSDSQIFVQPRKKLTEKKTVAYFAALSNTTFFITLTPDAYRILRRSLGLRQACSRPFRSG
jgi:hypothetical protein